MNHHPKTLMIAASHDESWMGDALPWDRQDFWSGPEALCFPFNAKYKPTDLVTAVDLAHCDLIIANLDRRHIDQLIRLQQQRGPNVKWVSLIERCATDYLPADPRIKQLLDGSDLINVINKHSLGFFRALTTARCEYIGIPYPAEGIRHRFSIPLEERKNYIMLPPYVDPPGITHNASYLAARVAKLPMYGAQQDKYNYGDINYHSLPYQEPLDYLKLEAESIAFVNLDHRYTWGRNVLDCAALGVPCIATKATGHAEDFFPSLMVNNEFCIEEAANNLKSLLNGDWDMGAYDPLFHYPRCQQIMQEYTHERIAQKIMEAIN